MAQSGPLIRKNVPFVPCTGLPPRPRLVVLLKASLWYILGYPVTPLERDPAACIEVALFFFFPPSPSCLCRWCLVYARANTIVAACPYQFLPFCLRCHIGARIIYPAAIEGLLDTAKPSPRD